MIIKCVNDFIIENCACYQLSLITPFECPKLLKNFKVEYSVFFDNLVGIRDGIWQQEIYIKKNIWRLDA